MKNKDNAYGGIVGMWRDFRIENSIQLDAHLNSFAVLFAYNSGSIENREITYHDTREIFEHGKVINFTGDLKTLYEIENMKTAHKLMLRWYDESVELTQERIKEMHLTLTRGTYDERRWALGERPGEYKKNDIWVIGKNELAAPIDEIDSEMEDVLEQLCDIDDSHALTAAAWFHLRFEGIHAFADGNGRVGRALMNYFLIRHHHPPIIIYEEDKRAYYDALDHFDETGDLKPMVSLLQGQTEKTWQATYSRLVSHDRERPIGISLEAARDEMLASRKAQGRTDAPPSCDDPSL